MPSSSTPALDGISPSSVSMMMLFGTVTFATAGMAARTWLLGDNRAWRAALDIANQHQSSNSSITQPRPSAQQQHRSSSSFRSNGSGTLSSASSIPAWENNYTSIYTLLHHLTIFGFIMFCTYLLEHHAPLFFQQFELSDDRFDADSFMFLCCLVVFIAWHTWQRNDGLEIDQTEELKKKNKGYQQGKQKVDEDDDDDEEEMETLGDDSTFVGSRSAYYGKVPGGKKSSAMSLASGISTSDKSIENLQQQQAQRGIHSIMEEDTDKKENEGGIADASKGDGEEDATTFASVSIGTDNDGGGGKKRRSSVQSTSSSNASPSADNRKLVDVLLDDGDDENIMLTPSKLLAQHHTQTAAAWADVGVMEESIHRPDSMSRSMSAESKRYSSLLDAKSIPPPTEEVLNMDQTLEWRGFVTAVFLVYRMTNATSYIPTSPSSFSSTYNKENSDSDDENILNRYYNMSRLGSTILLFLTGYGHTTYFYRTRDYSLVRVLRVLFRINLTAVILCLTLGNPYLLYNICPLHSYSFLMIYFVMKYKSFWNYSKYGLRWKCMVLACIIFLLWDLDLGLFRLVHTPFVSTVVPSRGEGSVAAPYGQMWEWYHRTHVQHWSAFIGMVFAINHPITSLLLRKLDVMDFIRGNCVSYMGKVSKAIIAVGLASATFIWALGPLRSTRFSYNAVHPYFGFIPVLCYVYLRNITPALRAHHFGLFRYLGTHTLEIYLLHHHIFLSRDGTTMLTILIGYPACNALLVGSILILVSQVLRGLTSVLIEMALPRDDESKCIRSVFILGGSIVAFFAVSLALDMMGMVNLGTIAAVTVICGILLYQTVMDMTWVEHRNAGLIIARQVKERRRQRFLHDLSALEAAGDGRKGNGMIMEGDGGSDDLSHGSSVSSDDLSKAEIRSVLHMDESPVAKISPPLIGALVVFLLGVTWHVAALASSSSSSSHYGKRSVIGNVNSMPLLGEECDVLANDGRWVPINSCTEYHRGMMKREYGVGGYYGKCDQITGDSKDYKTSGLLSWGWTHGMNAALTSSSSSSLSSIFRPLEDNTNEGTKSTSNGDELPSAKQCHFRYRNANEIQLALQGRSIVFVGDSMARNLYHAACRALGDLNAGGYDATVPTHSDITKTFFGDITLEYKWAPLAVDEISKLRDLQYGMAGSPAPPDMIVVGGGAWDRLHVWATDEDQESHRSNVKKLASELTELRSRSVSTVWFTPTTINTRALNNDEKRTQMNEEGMEEMRALYAELGVESAADFVLDGPSFTMDRVRESYDGVNYPPDVYDAGAQILANAFDWLLLRRGGNKSVSNDFIPPQPGIMSNPFLGMMMLCFALIGLFFFDGYFGFSYLASLFVRSGAAAAAATDDPGYYTARQHGLFSWMPNDMYEEAFGPLHHKLKLPTISNLSMLGGGRNNRKYGYGVQDEIVSLLGGGASIITSSTASSEENYRKR